MFAQADKDVFIREDLLKEAPERLGKNRQEIIRPGEDDVERRSEYIHRLKPHVPREEALLAVEKIDSLR